MTRLDVQTITVRFGGVTAVDGATITADGGEVTALIGPNGAGKTTLFNVITGLQRPSSGHVFLNGNDITHTPTHQRARFGIARTFQRLEAFGSLTVAENVRVAADAAAMHHRSKQGVAGRRGGGRRGRGGGFVGGGLGGSGLGGSGGGFGGRSRAARREVPDPALVTRTLIARIGLSRYADAPADSVPTGIARLLELARALAIDPDLLLLDEPSSGLSEAETESFGALLRELAGQGRAVLIVEHDMPLIMGVSDRIHVLDRGSVIASGTPAEVQADPAVRKAYLGEADAGAGPASAADAGAGAEAKREAPAERTLVMPEVSGPAGYPGPGPDRPEEEGWFLS